MNYGQTHNGALDFNDGANADCEYQYDSGGDCEYQYDSNGALTRDCNRGINSITHHFYYLGNGIIITSLSGLLKKVRRLRTLCPKASDSSSEGFGQKYEMKRKIADSFKMTKPKMQQAHATCRERAACAPQVGRIRPSYFAFHSVMLRSFDEKARPTFVTGRPSRAYLAA